MISAIINILPYFIRRFQTSACYFRIALYILHFYYRDVNVISVSFMLTKTIFVL